jgi:hypothetical protein
MTWLALALAGASLVFRVTCFCAVAQAIRSMIAALAIPPPSQIAVKAYLP